MFDLNVNVAAAEVLRVLARVTVTAVAVLALCACGGPTVASGREGRISGALELTEGARGDGWVFLYAPGQGPPLTQAFPDQTTAVSDLRIKDGDPRFLFASVEPNAYRLWAFLDTNLNFETEIDVLGAAGAGDRISQGVELNLQPGQHLEQSLPVRQFVEHEPPAFHIEGAGSYVELFDQPNELVQFDLRANALGVLEPQRTGFVVGLGDKDGDGTPDDGNGDRIPDLYPEIYLRFLRRPGQVVPLDSRGEPAEVIVPLAFSPGPFLSALAGDPSAEVVVDRLQAFLLPQAQAITFETGRGRVVTPMDAIPVGEYELWVVTEAGQFWRIPNDLGTEKAQHLGGPFPSQRVTFRFVHR